MLLFACAVAMFVPTLNANKSLKFCKSASSHSETHLFTYPEFIIILMMFASIIHAWESVLHSYHATMQHRNPGWDTSTSSSLKSGLELWGPALWLPCTHNSNASASWSLQGYGNILKHLHSQCLKPYCFLNSIDVCHRFPNSLASVLAFFGFLDCQWNNLIC